MAAWQPFLLLAVLASYAAGESAQSAETASLTVTFSISLPVTSCSISPVKLEAVKGVIADVVAARASKRHRKNTVLINPSTCSPSTGGESAAKFTRTVQISYKGSIKTRSFILGSLRKQGPCRTFSGICRILNGTNGDGCIVDALDPSNLCGKTGTCSPPCVNGRCVGSQCICTAGYYGMQCQRYYGRDKLTFLIPKITPGTSPTNHRHTAKLLVKATKGWPLVCILRANLNHLNDTVYKPVAGDHMVHPVHACPHLLTPKSRAAFHSGALLKNPGNASQHLELHANIDLSTGKLKLADTLSDEYSFMNTTSGPLGTAPLPEEDDGYDAGDVMLRYNDTAFYDQRLAALAGTTAPADPVTFTEFVKLDAYLRSPASRRFSSDSDDENQKMNALGRVTQALTQQLAAPWMGALLLHLTRLDDDQAAVEADLSKQRGESCDLTSFQIRQVRMQPDFNSADLVRLRNLQDCFCDPSKDTTVGCLAYADVVANDTANAYQNTSEGAASSRSIPPATTRVQSVGMPTKDEPQGNRKLRRVLAAAHSSPVARVNVVTAAGAGAMAEVATALKDVAWQSSASTVEPWSQQAMGGSQVTEFVDHNAFTPVLISGGSRQLQQTGTVEGVFCNWQTNKEMSSWKNFLFTNGVAWVINGPSVNLQCCLPVPGTVDTFVVCFGYAMGSFNFKGLNANLLTQSADFNLQNVLNIADVYCKDRQDCADTCGDSVQAAKPAGPQGEQWVCKLDKGGAVLDELNFNFMNSFTIDFCVNFVKATGTSNVIKGILSMLGFSPCFIGFATSTYPLRGWDVTQTVYFQILFIKISITWDIATQEDMDHCAHFCHCYPGNNLFGMTPYCRMCTNKKKTVETIDISFRLLFFKFTIYNSVGNLPSPKKAACPAQLRKLSASSDMRRHDMFALDDLFSKIADSSTSTLKVTDNLLATTGRAPVGSQALGGVPMSCSSCNATDSCLISRNANQSMTTCTTLSKEDVHVWLKMSVQDCLSGDCQNCTMQTGDVAGSCAKCNQCLSCAPGATAGNSGVGSYCGNNATQKEFNDWHTVQDWIDDLVINGADAPCPCKAAESCMMVTPTLLDGEGRPLRNGICLNLTLPQTTELLAGVNANWPGTLDGHTHDVGCSEGLTLALTLRNPPKHSWHGPSSFCAWWTGAMAFVDGATDINQSVGLPCGPREGALTSNTSTDADLCPPVPGLVCAWDNTCSFAAKHRWSAWGCQQAYTSNTGGCISTSFDNSTGLTIEQADCSIYQSNFQYYGEYDGAPPPSWSTNSSCNGQPGVLRANEFLEARNYDGHSWRMVLQGDGRLMVYWLHFHDFFDGIQHTPLLLEGTALRPAVGRQIMFSHPDFNTAYWKSNGYFRAGPTPYMMKITHDGLFMSSADPGLPATIWSLTWSSIGVGPFDKVFPVSIRGTNMTTYVGWFSVCGLPLSHVACTLDGQATVAGQPQCSSLEKCHPWIKLQGPE